MSCQLTILISQKVKRAVVFSFFQSSPLINPNLG